MISRSDTDRILLTSINKTVMNTITIILVVAAAIAVMLLPLLTVIFIIINPVWGWWGMYNYVPRYKSKRESQMETWKEWHVINKIRYKVFFRAIRQHSMRYVRFTYFASLFFLWGYPIFAIRHLLVWGWKQV